MPRRRSPNTPEGFYPDQDQETKYTAENKEDDPAPSSTLAASANMIHRVKVSSCDRLALPSEEYASAARSATEGKRAALQKRIRTLHPGICANVAPLLFLVTFYLLWTAGVPMALLLFTRSNPDHANATAMRIIGWCFLGTGGAYLLACILPIITLGGCCMPRAPPKDGPLIRKPLPRHALYASDSAAQEKVTAGAESASSTSAVPLLQPQVPVHRDVSNHCVYILLNSHGQHGVSAKEKAEKCRNALTDRNCCVHTIETQYAGHLQDLGRDPILLPLTAGENGSSSDHSSELNSVSRPAAVSAILIIGGDGSFSEFVNGYMARCIAEGIAPADRTPLALIPAGTGNSLARDVYTDDLAIETAIATVLHGATVLIDISAITDQGGLEMYSTNVISFGLVGDTAVVAEDYRVLGDARYDICAVWFVLRKVTSSARFLLEGLGGSENARRGRQLDWSWCSSAVDSMNLSALPPSDANAPYSREAIQLYGRKTTAFFNQTSHFAKGLRAAPHAKIDDGLLDCVFGESASRTNLLTMFQQLPKGAHLKNQAISHFQVQQITMTRWNEEQTKMAEAAVAGGKGSGNIEAAHRLVDQSSDQYVINVDGENIVVQGTVKVRARLRQIPIFVPAGAVAKA